MTSDDLTNHPPAEKFTTGFWTQLTGIIRDVGNLF